MVWELWSKIDVELQVVLIEVIGWIVFDVVKGYFKHCGYASI